MAIVITAQIDPRLEEYYQELLDTLDVGEGKTATDTDVVNYAIRFIQMLDKTLERTANITDPVEFIKGVSDGTVLIVRR